MMMILDQGNCLLDNVIILIAHHLIIFYTPKIYKKSFQLYHLLDKEKNNSLGNLNSTRFKVEEE